MARKLKEPLTPERIEFVRRHTALRENLIRDLDQQDMKARISDYMRRADAILEGNNLDDLKKPAVEEALEPWQIDMPGVEFLPSEIGTYTVCMTPKAAGIFMDAMVRHIAENGWSIGVGDQMLGFNEQPPRFGAS